MMKELSPSRLVKNGMLVSRRTARWAGTGTRRAGARCPGRTILFSTRGTMAAASSPRSITPNSSAPETRT